MHKALMLKELRETGWIALVALAAQLAFVANAAGYAIVPFWTRTGDTGIPFLDGGFMTSFCLISVALATALAMRQTAVESGRGTWLFLRHRPVSLWQVLWAKLAVGTGLYLTCGLIPILAYAAWAALPGKHASPFAWWMTTDAWKAWSQITMVYLGAFLAGIRPARWYGTRLLPLAAGGLFAVLLIFPMFWPLLGIATLLLVAAGLIGLIYFTACTRDFS